MKPLFMLCCHDVQFTGTAMHVREVFDALGTNGPGRQLAGGFYVAARVKFPANQQSEHRLSLRAVTRAGVQRSPDWTDSIRTFDGSTGSRWFIQNFRFRSWLVMPARVRAGALARARVVGASVC
jgi:hypothetical protein